MKQIQWQRLAVSAGSALTVAYFVAGCSPTSTDILPNANAGIDQVVNQQTWVHLAGSGNDVAGPIARYEWQQTSGTQVELFNGDHANPSFIAPAVDADETLSFRFTIYNSVGQSSSDSLDIDVKAETTKIKRRLNDSGITGSGNYPGGNNSTCIGIDLLAQQDCTRGRDSDSNDSSDGRVGFSFTKIGANGEVLPSNAPQWSCVLDNVTGFMWEVKTLANKDEVYSLEQAKVDYPNQVNNLNSGVGLCGFSDWRLPNYSELQSIVDYGRFAPSIDTDYFPNTAVALPIPDDNIDYISVYSKAYRVASNPERVTYNTEMVAIEFAFGSSFFSVLAVTNFADLTAVRLVRSSSPGVEAEYIVDRQSQTVLEQSAGLMWTRCLLGRDGDVCDEGNASTYNWADAIRYVEQLNQEGYKGFNDWRLPNVKELGLLVDFFATAESISEQEVFPRPGYPYPVSVWSSSITVNIEDALGADSGRFVWAADTASGHLALSRREDLSSLRLVRDVD